ncbi:MAG TPA: hypothetical protein VKP00_02885 [Gemmatimonadaceae bacterium]|nr:hypothetical protein [Gemmatimonadaceae bacterium]
MTHFNRTLLFVCALGAGLTTSRGVFAQSSSSQRGQPKTPFSVADFAKLRWLEGSWAGSATDESPIYARYHVANDSTIEIVYFRDSTFAQQFGTGRVYLAVGRIYHTFGSGRWGATNVDSAGVFFIPQVNAHNTFAWNYQSPDAWTLTQRSGASGHERVTVYHMRRVGRR